MKTLLPTNSLTPNTQVGESAARNTQNRLGAGPVPEARGTRSGSWEPDVGS
jgi:hypothetical protein